MLGINARVEDLKIRLIQDINEAKMPACILDYVVTELLNDIRQKRAEEVTKERMMEKEVKKTEKEGDGDESGRTDG